MQALYNFVFIILNRTTEKTIADSLPIENLSENPSPREITKVSNILLNSSVLSVSWTAKNFLRVYF